MRCEAVFRNSGGTEVRVPFDVADGATNDQIETAAQEAIRQRHLSNGIVDVTVSYDVFVDRHAGGTLTESGDERLYRTSTGTLAVARADRARPGGSNPLTYRVGWARDQILRANMRNSGSIDTDPTRDGVQAMPALESLTYTTDGTAGPLSADEARSFVQRFEALFGNDDAGRARLRHVYEQNPVFEMGPDGNHRLVDIYSRAGLTPPNSIARPETGAVPGSDGSAGGASDPSITDFISNPTPTNASRLRADKARTDELINILLAALAAGNTDVLTTVMDLVARNGRGTVAQLAMSTITQLRSLDDQIGRINEQIQGLNTGSENATERSRATSEFQRLQVQLSTLNSQRQSIIGMLETTMRAMEEEGRAAQSIRDSYARAHAAGQPR